MKLHKMFSRQLCSAGTEAKFNKLYRKFKGYGYYVPSLPNGDLDRASVLKYLPEIEKKRDWIKGVRKKLEDKSIRHFKRIKKEIKKIEQEFQSLLILKHRYFKALGRGSSGHAYPHTIRRESRMARKKFAQNFESFLEKVFFLLSYRFPVDHFDLRKSYDQYKDRKDIQGKQKANDIYFLRFIVEDGAQDPDHTSSDRFLRANLNTLALNLRKTGTL